MTVKAHDKARAKDWKNAQEQWVELVEILRSNYQVKAEGKHEILLSIRGQEKADIEVFLTGKQAIERFHIQLWYYEFIDNRERTMQSKRVNTLAEAIRYIDALLENIRMNERAKREIP